MKTYKLILLVLSLVGLLLTSCSSDDGLQQTLNTPGITDQGIVPDWLEGVYKPVLHPDTDETGIYEEQMHLNFAAFNGPVLFFYTQDVASELTNDTTFVVHYYDEQDIVFKRSDTNSDHVHITYITGGLTLQYGIFERIE